MRNPRYHKFSKGFTLAELMVTIVTFSLFSLSMVALLIMGMKYFKQADSDIVCQQNITYTLDVLSSDIKQSMKNSATGTGPILYPNSSNTTGVYVEFYKPNPDTYDPTSESFSETDPSNYEKIKYYVQGTTLYRQVTTYSSNGSVNQDTTNALAENPDGTVTFTTKYVSATRIDITLTLSNSRKTTTSTTPREFSATATCFLMN